jgi:spore coat polysaccharide biosynthesis predicted glycosyltransferase SpsG
MKAKSIAILTGSGAELGTGHMQRMTSLMIHLNRREYANAYIITDKIQHSITDSLSQYFKTDFQGAPDLIIRDKRDSSIEEMTKLREISRVIAVDDAGEGRPFAYHIIDLLPNHLIDSERTKHHPQKDLFIYGYNFLSSLTELAGMRIEKTIDFTIYPGSDADEHRLNLIISLLPVESNFAMMTGKHSYAMRHGRKYPIAQNSYGEIILSSRVVISHFGIMLYEAHLAGCTPIAINPTSYHSELSDMAAESINLINLGEYGSLNKTSSSEIIKETLNHTSDEAVPVDEVLNRMEKNIDNFIGYIKSIL